MIPYVVGRNLGHLSRCVAVVEQFQSVSQEPVQVYTFPHSHPWMKINLPNVSIQTFSKKNLYENRRKFLKAKLIMHDWRKELSLIKQARENKGTIIGGIYHSDLLIDGEDTEWTAKFKKEVYDIAEQTTNVFFHINLTKPIWFPKLSTYYLPIPMITRKIHMPPWEVKKRLGIPIDEPFILVHMGGGVGPYRYKYMDEWFEKIKLLKSDYRIVVANQFGGIGQKFPKTIVQAPLFANGRDFINAADLVISEPGMGILIDCISTGTPLLALPADTKERQVKNMMLKKLLGSDLCIVSHGLPISSFSSQIQEVINHAPHIQAIFQRVPQNGAEVVAACMKLLLNHTVKDLPELYPKLLALSPFG